MDSGISSKTTSGQPEKVAGPSDIELVKQARDGRTEAFDALILRHQNRVYNTAYRMLGSREDALDVTQEIFLTVFRRLDRFEEKARFSTWLYRVAINRCRDELRRRSFVKHTRPQSLDAPMGADRESKIEPAAADPSPAEGAMADEAKEAVHKALARLPGESREILVLRDLQGLGYDAVAEVLSIPIGTVRSRLSRARGLLRDRLRPILGVEP